MEEKQLRDLGLDFEVKDEETAQKYIEFMQGKLDDLQVQNLDLAQKEAKRYEELLDSMPRKVRRKYLKSKFSDQFKQHINTKRN